METVTSSFVRDLSDQARKFGKSKPFEIEESAVGYFRMLLSRYNTKNDTEICVRRVHNLYWEVRAPFNRFFDQQPWQPAFDVIQRILSDPDYKPSESEFLIVQEKLQSIGDMCEKRFLGSQHNATKENDHDVLK